ncbi:conserved protein of unknown function [Limnospira indica PCC 8005]|uniref:Uncharacterized protein n=1 Tax=Limnospira indica PCC 8005 TaxID=376219 RepID=A0A9P1KEU2_9CYAN|nr:conserved protein of unknown function [Limnospira indica PCC 8005]
MHRPLKYPGGQDKSKDGMPTQMERLKPLIGSQVAGCTRGVVKSVSVWCETFGYEIGLKCPK